MVEENITSLRNVVDLVIYRQDRACGRPMAMSARLCRHCGAPLLDGENEDECSSSSNLSAQRSRETLRRIRVD